jgi:hypothetical protein
MHGIVLTLLPSRMLEKDKNRLYITLQHRLGKPGFHWALLLAPKAESIDMQVKDSHMFHVTNAFVPFNGDLGPHYEDKPEWRYEDKPVNSMRSGDLIARVLVAKLPTNESLRAQAATIHRIAKCIPIVQDDANWTCHVWVEETLAALQAAGGYFTTIPQVVNGGQVENYIKGFGENAKARLLSRQRRTITRASDLPHIDMRIR